MCSTPGPWKKLKVEHLTHIILIHSVFIILYSTIGYGHTNSDTPGPIPNPEVKSVLVAVVRRWVTTAELVML